MFSPDAAILQTTPAQTLDKVYRTLQSGPLETKEQLDAFYREELNQVRGDNRTKRMEFGLREAQNDRLFYKALFMGHAGSGKSTELSRLVNTLQDQISPIRIRALSTLNPSSFQPLDVLLVMMIELVEKTRLPLEEGGANQMPSDARLREIWDWFAIEKNVTESVQSTSIAAEGGAGIKENSLWNNVLGLFAGIRSDIKYNVNRKAEITEHRISRLDELMKLANRLLDDCNNLLRSQTGREWLFIGEDFDKGRIPTARLEDLFINYGGIFLELRTHLIFNLPVNLYYSSQAPRLPFSGDSAPQTLRERSYVLPDIPVFQADKSPNQPGRDALVSILQVRMNLDLFAPDQMMRLIVASGGNLRDLFGLVKYAADTAIIDGRLTITEKDAKAAINHLRSDYERRLGQSPYDIDVVTYEAKAERLLKIYNNDSTAKIADPAVYSLLNARAVQEFNGKRWFGIHPLVVDILVEQGKIQPVNGAVPGGID